MNILLVYHELGFRGGERLFANLAKGLIAKNHSVSLIAGRSNVNKSDFPKKCRIITPPLFLNKLFQNNWLFIFFSIQITFLNILNLIKKIDVIYTGEAFTALWPSILASKIFNKKLVLSVFELKKAKFIENAVTINSSLIPSLKKSGVKNVTFIPPGIDFPKIKVKKSIKKIILMVGTIHPAKRQDIAIRALRLVKKQIPEAVLILAGGGDVSNLKINDSVIVTSYIKDEEINNLYSQASLCLMCGPIGGLTIIESIYFGKNIIYPTSGNPPLGPVEEHNLGIILPKNDPKLYADKIIDVLKNPKKYQEKLEKDRKFVTKNFSVERFTSKTLKILAPAKV